MIAPSIGELKDLIGIVNVTVPYGLDGAGTIVSTFKSNVRAKIEPLGGGLTEESQQIQSYNQGYNIWIRHINGVTAFQQISWSGKRLVMTGPPEKIGRWLLLHAEERTTREL